VSARANNRRLGFHGAYDGEHVAAHRHVVPVAFEVADQPSRTLDAQHRHLVETGRSHFPSEILGTVEIGRREIVDAPGLVAMLTVHKIPIAHSGKARIGRKVAREAVEGRCIA
jgi:hypothetical protein